MLFTFLAEPYERLGVIITSNLVISKWDQSFKDPMTTMGTIDRLELFFSHPSRKYRESLGIPNENTSSQLRDMTPTLK